MKWNLLRLSLGLTLGLAGCDNPQGPPQPTTPPAPKAGSAAAPATNSSGGIITAPVDYLGALSKGKTSSEKKIDSVTLNRAVQMFSATEGRYPKDLDELVKEGVLPKIPEPPYKHKYIYDAKAGTVQVVPE